MPRPFSKKAKFPFKPVSTSFRPAPGYQPVTITYDLDPAAKATLEAKTAAIRARIEQKDHGAAFAFGFVVAGLAGAAAALWKTPHSGAEIREMIADRTEATLFNVLGMDGYVTGEKTATAVAATQTPVDASTGSTATNGAGGSISDDDTQPFLPVETEPVAFPTTFRGEPLSDPSTTSTLPYNGSNNR